MRHKTGHKTDRMDHYASSSTKNTCPFWSATILLSEIRFVGPATKNGTAKAALRGAHVKILI